MADTEADPSQGSLDSEPGSTNKEKLADSTTQDASSSDSKNGDTNGVVSSSTSSFGSTQSSSSVTSPQTVSSSFISPSRLRFCKPSVTVLGVSTTSSNPVLAASKMMPNPFAPKASLKSETVSLASVTSQSCEGIIAPSRFGLSRQADPDSTDSKPSGFRSAPLLAPSKFNVQSPQNVHSLIKPATLPDPTDKNSIEKNQLDADSSSSKPPGEAVSASSKEEASTNSDVCRLKAAEGGITTTTGDNDTTSSSTSSKFSSPAFSRVGNSNDNTSLGSSVNLQTTSTSGSTAGGEGGGGSVTTEGGSGGDTTVDSGGTTGDGGCRTTGDGSGGGGTTGDGSTTCDGSGGGATIGDVSGGGGTIGDGSSSAGGGGTIGDGSSSAGGGGGGVSAVESTDGVGAASLPSSGGEFLFGTNLHKRVVGIGQNSEKSNNCSGFVFGENLADRVLAADKPSSPPLPDQNDSSDEDSTPEKPCRSLEESAREYQMKHGVRTEYKEIEVKTGEEDESNVLQSNCKLFVFDQPTLMWIERGRGVLRLNDLVGNDSEKFQSRLVMRSQGSLRVILNTKIWTGMTVKKASPKSVRITATDGDGVKVFLIVANPKDSDNIMRAIDWRIQQLKTEEEELEKQRNTSKRKSESQDRISPNKKLKKLSDLSASASSGECKSVSKEESDSSVLDPETEASNESYTSSQTVRSESD